MEHDRGGFLDDRVFDLIALNMVYFGGLSLNIMTLMGIAMGFGIIVDNAIVILENVYRLWHEGMDGEAAVEKGSAT